MPRKKFAEAEARVVQAQTDRLRYLSRRQGFRRMIDWLTELRDALPGTPGQLTWERIEAYPKFLVSLQVTAEKWGVAWDLLSVLSSHAWHENRSPQERIPSAASLSELPVIAWTNSFLTLPGKTGFGSKNLEPTPGDSRYLNLRVDLDHPVDALVPLIEKELAIHSRKYLHGRRRRTDTVDFNLGVFDRVVSGQPFKAISTELKVRLSTVKSAYLAACRAVFEPGTAPSKKQVTLDAFNLTDHFEKCPVCRQALNPEQMCAAARIYVEQDQKGRSELPGYDTSR
jgi:hypothetical protein